MKGYKSFAYSLVLLPYLLCSANAVDKFSQQKNMQDAMFAPSSYNETNTTGSTNIYLEKSDKDSSQILSVTPQVGSIQTKYSYIDSKTYQMDIGGIFESNRVKNDAIFDASIRMLYAGAKLGTYIGIAKGSELEKFVLSQGFALENGTIKLSASLLKRLTELDFSEYSKSYNETLTQKSLGAEHSYRFDNDKLLQEIKTSIVYYDLDGKNLGHITDIIIDNATLYDWSAVYGGYRGGSKLLAMSTAVLKLSDALRATLSLGYDKLTYDAMFDTPKSDSAKLASGASLAYRFNNYHQVESYIQNLNSQQTLGARYAYDLGNAFSGYLTLEKINREYGEDDTQLRLGIIYSFGNGERHTKLPTLFANNTQKDTLSLSQLSPISSVNYDNFAISPRKTTYIEHIARVDKTALGAGDGIGLNSDGTLASIYFDNGGFTVTSIDSVNDSTYMPYLGIEGGKLALVNIMALNAHMKAQGLTTGQTKTLNIAVSDTSGSGISLYSITITKGSVQLNATAQKAHNATALQRTAFLAGTQTIAQINTANAGGQVPPVMGDVPNQNATSGTAYSLNVSTFTTLTNADPISAYTLTGALPTGVTFDSGTGLLSGTPTQTGTFNLSVTATDNDGVSNNDAFTLTVAAANTIPVLSGATSTGDIFIGDNLTNIGLTITDDNLALVTWTLSYIGGGAGDTGTFSQSTGTGNTLSGITFTPTIGGSTGWTVKATVTDSGSGNSQEVIIYSNTGVNTAPVVSNYTSGNIGRTALVHNFSGDIADTEQSDATLASNITVVTGPAHGTLTWNPGALTWTYTPTAGYTGTDTFTYKVNDGTVDSNVGTVTINGIDTITPNTPVWTTGVTTKSTVYTARKVTLSVGASGISATGLSVTAGGAISNVSVSGGVITFDYTTPNAVGDTISISGTSVAGTAFSTTIDTPALSAPANTAPVVSNYTSGNIGNFPLAYDLSPQISDAEQADASLTLSTVIAPIHGTVTWSGQTFTYTPNAGYTGTDTFTYKANDGTTDSVSSGTVTINGIDTIAINTLVLASASPDTQGIPYTLHFTAGENLTTSGVTCSSSKGGTCSVGTISGTDVEISYNSPTGLSGDATATTDTITVSGLKDAAGNPFGDKTQNTLPLNGAPLGENVTVDAGGASTYSTNVTLTDPNTGDTVSAVYVGSGVLTGDLVISSYSVSGNTVGITVNGGSGNGYVDYKVNDGRLDSPTYRVTFNNLAM